MNNQYIAYYRVSTNKQKNSGLGLDAQRQQVNNYINLYNGLLIGQYEDVESGTKSQRANLAEAIQQCILTNSTLLIAKLDRLSRNVAFLAQLLESKVNFVCCDNPHANKLTIHILAAVAEDESVRVSERTKAALAQAKLKGVKLGTNNLPKSDNVTALRARATNTEKANSYNQQILNKLRHIKDQSYRKQARYLNNSMIKTRLGKRWHTNSVRRLYIDTF